MISYDDDDDDDELEFPLVSCRSDYAFLVLYCGHFVAWLDACLENG